MLRVFLLVLLFGITSFAGEIRVAVAANVGYAMADLVKKFNQKNHNIKVVTILGSSGKLYAQIKHRAPYDLFISADMKFPQALYDDGLSIAPPKVYAMGALICFSKKPQDFTKGIFVLKDKNIDKIAIANPKTAPYGIAAYEVLKNTKIYDDIKSKLVYGESVSQTLTYVMSVADIGLVAKSSMYSTKMRKYKKGVFFFDVDSSLYNPIKQGIVILKSAKKEDDATKFYNFILSDDAKEILLKYGYNIP